MKKAIVNYTIADGEFYKAFFKGTQNIAIYGRLEVDQIMTFNDDYDLVWITEQEYRDLVEADGDIY